MSPGRQPRRPAVAGTSVDVVLSFEGDKHSTLRMIRGIKNRFGASDEVGCFEQHDDGIHEVPDPSGIFLHQRSADVFGSVTMVTMDGKRALVGEVQALANGDDLHNPRRAVSGLDAQRIAMILAVLQANGYPKVGKQEVYVSTVGGMKVTEPAVDLPRRWPWPRSSNAHLSRRTPSSSASWGWPGGAPVTGIARRSRRPNVSASRGPSSPPEPTRNFPPASGRCA